MPNSGHETFDALLTIAISPKLCVDSAIILLPAAVPNCPAICQLHSPLAALLPECGHTLWPQCGHTLWPEVATVVWPEFRSPKTNMATNCGHKVATLFGYVSRETLMLWPLCGHNLWPPLVSAFRQGAYAERRGHEKVDGAACNSGAQACTANGSVMAALSVASRGVVLMFAWFYDRVLCAFESRLVSLMRSMVTHAGRMFP